MILFLSEVTNLRFQGWKHICVTVSWWETGMRDPTENTNIITHCDISLADLRGGARNAPPPGVPNSFIFMQFSGKKLKNNSTIGSWCTPLGKILDPPLHLVANVNSEQEVCSKGVRTHFLCEGVNVMVSWWSSSCDGHPDSERPGFDPPLRP